MVTALVVVVVNVVGHGNNSRLYISILTIHAGKRPPKRMVYPGDIRNFLQIN